MYTLIYVCVFYKYIFEGYEHKSSRIFSTRERYINGENEEKEQKSNSRKRKLAHYYGIHSVQIK